jgi:hypothetical protein
LFGSIAIIAAVSVTKTRISLCAAESTIICIITTTKLQNHFFQKQKKHVSCKTNETTTYATPGGGRLNAAGAD